MADLHRSTIGKIGESLVLAKMLEQGLEVYEAIDGLRGADLSNGERLHHLQDKWSLIARRSKEP